MAFTYQIELIGPGIYCTSMEGFGYRQYLVLGKTRALLIDTGMGIGSLKETLKTVTDLPITVICTHGHPDHAGGNAEFAPAYMNPADLDVYQQMASKEYRIQDLSQRYGEGHELFNHLQPTGPNPVFAQDGMKMELGERTLEVIFTPGHTHGSLCVYDEMTKTLFSGDNIMAKQTTMHEWNSSTVEEYVESLKKLLKYDIERILTGHPQNDNPGSLLNRMLPVAMHVLAGKQGESKRVRGIEALEYKENGLSIVYLPDRIYKK